MRVTLDVFSGRPNPSWELSSWDIRVLQARVADKALSPAPITHPTLGFRGLVVSLQTDDIDRRLLPATFRLGSPASAVSAAEIEAATPVDGEMRDTAQWLLRTATGSLHPSLLAYASAEMQKPLRATAQTNLMGAAQARVTLPSGVQPSPYNPGYWDDPSVQPFNNCYNFATNFRSDTTAQPGRISGTHYSEFSCWNVGTAASYDGVDENWRAVSNFVALVIWPGVDFHWYRLQAEGFWAHKVGHGQATNSRIRRSCDPGRVDP